jgi:hypothetical protein
MVKKVPDAAAWGASYKDGAVRKAGKWQSNFLATTGIAAAASSDAAQAAYTRKMMDPAVLAVRQTKLKKLSDADFQAPVRAGGSGMYSSGVSAKADKAAKGVAPFLTTIQSVINTLPAKTDDVDANIDNRVKPLARALRAQKRGAT